MQFKKFSLYEECPITVTNHTQSYCTSDSYEKLAEDMLQFIGERYIPARGQHKIGSLTKFVHRFANLKASNS